MSAQIIAFPKVNKRTGESPTLDELMKLDEAARYYGSEMQIKHEPLSAKMRALLKNFGGVRA